MLTDVHVFDYSHLSMTVLTELADAVDALCAADPSTLADSDTIQTLHRHLARLEAATVRATAAFDAAGHWRPTGARTAAAWLSVRCGLPLPTCRRRVHLGRALRHMPTAEAAWLTG